MSFIHYIKLLWKNVKWFIIIPLIMALSIYFFTKGEKKSYTSESIIYTGIASGYSLNGTTKADYFVTSNAFDNLLSLINSRETKQEVAIELLSSHLFLKQPDESILSADSYEDLKKLVPDDVRKKVVKSTLSETIDAVTDYMQAKNNNLIYTIINSDNPFYSVNALSKINAARINSSDLIKISYETNDAAICKHTLELLEDAFMRKHRLLKEGQTESVIAYFERETRKAYARLDSIEDIFLAFTKQNDIINYYEQTKAVAGEKESLYALNHSLEMDRVATGSALDKVNDNMKGRLYQILYSSDVINQRDKLSDVYNKIALNETIGKNADASKTREIDSLKEMSSAIEKNLQTTLDKLYSQTNTPNGIPTKSVLDEWLKATIASEQSKARLTTMDKRKKEFVDEYRKLAPLGATLKKIERQITVAEQEYLELLHGLSLAKLMQQNNELTSKLTIVDPPYLPIKPNASKRALQIVLGFVVGFILVLAFLLAYALINKTVQQPNKASKIVNLPLLGIYPLLKENNIFIAKANLRLLQHFLSLIDTTKTPAVIGIVSIQKSEGKSTISDILRKELSAIDYKVEQQTWSNNYSPNANNADITILEFPALDDLVIKPNSLPYLNHTILICRANRIWNKLDKDLLSMYNKSSKSTPTLILNGVDADFAEEYIGEIPKRRNAIRATLKRLVKFEFGNRRKIS